MVRLTPSTSAISAMVAVPDQSQRSSASSSPDERDGFGYCRVVGIVTSLCDSSSLFRVHPWFDAARPVPVSRIGRILGPPSV